jgi:heme A synthase
MQFIVEAHKTLSNMIQLYALVVGTWGLFNFIRRRAPDGSYNGALVIGVGLFIFQGIIGIVLALLGLIPSRGWLHILYGITIVVTIPGIFAITRGSNTVRESMLYGLGMIFIWGLAERAVETG